MRFKIKLFLFLLIVFIVVHIPGRLSSQKLYKTSIKQSGVILGSAVGSFGLGYLIEQGRDDITLADLAALDKASLNSFDRGATSNFSDSARATSDRFRDAAWITPMTLFLSGQARENSKEILVMYAEVTSLTAGITGLVKGSVGRYRPYSYDNLASEELRLSTKARRSFFSGHVSHSAALSFFTAAVFDDLYGDSNYKYVVWAGAITAPAITGYLRIKAGKHFPTDVIAGYGLGALVGYFIPELHKLTQDTDISIIGAEGGIGLSYDF